MNNVAYREAGNGYFGAAQHVKGEGSLRRKTRSFRSAYSPREIRVRHEF